MPRGDDVSEDSRKQQRRRRKIIIVLVGALIAIGGTLATDFYQAKLESEMTLATDEAADFQYWAKRDNDLVQEARHDDQIASLVKMQQNRTDARFFEALNASTAAFRLHQAVVELRGRAVYHVTRKSAEARVKPASSCAPIPNVAPPTGDETSLYAALGDAGEKKRDALGEVWECYARRLDRAAADENDRIDDLKGRISRAKGIATILQLTGIAIAFMKDVFD
jgi:hypothetical protein